MRYLPSDPVGRPPLAPASPPPLLAPSHHHHHHNLHDHQDTVPMEPRNRTPSYPPPICRRDGLPTLALSPSQIAQLRAIETRLLEQYLERYEDFVANQRCVDPQQWKPSKHAHGVKVFKRRSASSSSTPSSWYYTNPSQSERNEPMLLATGSIDGRVEDVLYGALWGSRDERLTRAHYTKDGVVDAAVLCAIDKASAMDPFRTLAVKWSRQRSLRSAAVIKDRDLVYLGATGAIKSAGGERLGFELRHSLTLPAFPAMAGGAVVRAELMACSFFRQLRGARVEVFHQASFDAGGGLLRVLAWSHAVDAFLGYAAVVDCALTKKLVRAVHWEAAQDPRTAVDKRTLGEIATDHRRCGVCAQPSNVLHRKCALCHMWICSHCSVKHEIFTPLPGRPPIARCFCRPCLARVAREDAAAFVLRDLEQFEQRTRPEVVPDALRAHKQPIPRRASDVADTQAFFAIESPPPPPPTAPLRRRQGSIPAPTAQQPPPPPPPLPMRTAAASSSSSRRMSVPSDRDMRYPIEPVINDENIRHSANRSRPSAGISTRATHNSNKQTPGGEILLRSDSGQKKWRHREREQPQIPDTGRRMTVLGSELNLPPPPPPGLDWRASLPGGLERRRRVTLLDPKDASQLPPQPSRRTSIPLVPETGGRGGGGAGGRGGAGGGAMPSVPRPSRHLPPRPSTSSSSSSNQHEIYLHSQSPPALGQVPLQERRQYVLLPQPDPQALTSRRIDQRGAFAPPRPVRSDKIIHIRSHTRPPPPPQYPPPPPPPRPSSSPPPPPPPSIKSDDEQYRRQVARDEDELAVNTLLAELCEIARMTNDFSHIKSSSMNANAASPASSAASSGRSNEGPPPLLYM